MSMNVCQFRHIVYFHFEMFSFIILHYISISLREK